MRWMIAEGLIDGNGVTEKHTEVTDGQVSEGGYTEALDPVEAYKAIEETVVGTYQKIEDGVVGGYKKVEQGAVSGFQKISDKFVEKFLRKPGETLEEAKERLNKK